MRPLTDSTTKPARASLDDHAGCSHTRQRVRRLAGAWPSSVALAVVAAAAVAVPLAAAVAQGFSWPWSEPERKPIPREPVYRAPPQPAPGAQPSPGYQTAPGYQTQPAPYNSARSNICLQLEQRLVQESQKGTQSRDLLPKLEADIKAAQKAAQSSEIQLERQDCYEYFLFSKTLRRTRQCVELSTQAEAAKRRVSDLDVQRQQIVASSGRSFQDDIVKELARNNCGANYVQEARKREGGFWDSGEDSGPYGGSGNQFGALPYATYRTVCVRLCDGFYFPISFATLPNHFQRDADACQSKCAAPVELYYHQNPGSSIEQAVAAKTQEPYTRLKSAFRYRKEYVNGCSCKQAEYTPPAGTLSPTSGPGTTVPLDRRSEAGGGAGSAPPAATAATRIETGATSSWETSSTGQR